MSKGWGRAAFSFSGKAKNLFKVVGGKGVSKANIIFLAIDTAISLVEAGCSYMRYQYAKEYTGEIKEQVHAHKEEIDTRLEEEEKRSSFLVKDKQRIMLQKLHNHEQKLKQELAKIRGKYERELSRHEVSHEQILRKIDLQKQVREPIKQAMDLFSEMLEMAREKEEHFNIIAELEEQYRICATEYEKVIQNLL
jgi:hypothetical protein